MLNRLIPPAVILSLLLGLTAITAQADPVCDTYWDPVNQNWVTVCSGNGISSGNSGAGNNNSGIPGGSCAAGSTIVSTVIIGGGGLCEVWEIRHDPCIGQVAYANLVNVIQGGACTPGSSNAGSKLADNPCTVLNISPSGVYCRTDWGIRWLLDARVGFPNAFLDLRPYPVTLVRWPGAARNGGTPSAKGTGRLAYIAYGGGSKNNPALGDWDKVRLTLTLSPASPLMFFSMPTVGTITLPISGDSGGARAIVFDQPSHPAAGARTTAGAVGLDELPSDIPVFSGSAVTAYRLFWRLTFSKYVRDCKAGPDRSNGRLNCKVKRSSTTNDGHWAYQWEKRSQGGEITPQMVQGLPPGMAADLDGDGAPDAYWNRKITIRRMDENNRIDNPAWAESWSWGGPVYWAVREGQGQIGWP